MKSTLEFSFNTVKDNTAQNKLTYIINQNGL